MCDKLKLRIKNIFDNFTVKDTIIFIENNIRIKYLKKIIRILNKHYNKNYNTFKEFLYDNSIDKTSEYFKKCFNILFKLTYNNFKKNILNNIIPNTYIVSRKITSNLSPDKYINYIQPLGIYWTKNIPKAYWGKNKKYTYTFLSEITYNDIDIFETIVARSKGYMGYIEDEINLKSGNKIKLLDINCELTDGQEKVFISKKLRNEYINKYYTV